jgi:indole-3-glycerol phosphate synthase
MRLGEAGVHAVLIGEALMREADVGAKVREILGR